ncbi:LysR family transcriptional regulator [Kosakonia radicincitans UMEnt01/12]|uniref:LysR family transcriptional regulator n=1 Tax=Kosakonia radicincitans TaxID=283686 RepID=UPI000460D187|nr:LysR family transcriptional regulator [Kosakonia radicincitans]KDE36657.1 LysR family transcriptional regulator [Kosakonia radicincitans UMEnt01/12]
MIRLEDVTLFVRSAMLGSFSNAAREAGLLPGQVSAAVNRLERDLDKRLFVRSTRSLRLTAEGEKYLPFAQEMLEVVQAGAESLHSGDNEIRGELRVAVPSDIGRNVLLPLITRFCQQYPKISLRLSLSDQVSDVFRDPVDIAIRYGVLDNSSYVALPVAEDNRRVLAASPDYLAQHGRPKTLDEVVNHHCLLFTMNNQVYDKWSFPENGMRRQLIVKSRMLCDDADIARRWAVDGMGIVYKSWIDISADVLAGRLEVLLPQHVGEAAPLNLVCPHRKQFNPAIRHLHSVLRENLRPITALLQTHPVFKPHG